MLAHSNVPIFVSHPLIDQVQAYPSCDDVVEAVVHDDETACDGDLSLSLSWAEVVAYLSHQQEASIGLTSLSDLDHYGREEAVGGHLTVLEGEAYDESDVSDVVEEVHAYDGEQTLAVVQAAFLVEVQQKSASLEVLLQVQVHSQNKLSRDAAANASDERCGGSSWRGDLRCRLRALLFSMRDDVE